MRSSARPWINTTAEIERDLGRVDTAEQFAQTALRTFGEPHCRGLTLTNITLATVYVQAGEPRGMALAATAIDSAACLHSVVVRHERLTPLTTALDARPGGDARELARKARQVAATGAT
jgi:hypothetical protein